MGAQNKPISEKKTSGKEMSAGCMMAFGSIFLIVGLIASWFLLFKPVAAYLGARDWVETECAILSCNLEEKMGDESMLYAVRIRYKYTVDGRDYESDRYDFHSGSSNVGVERKRSFVKSHRPGSPSVCCVDPDNPSEATMERGFSWEMLFGLIPMVFVLAGGGIIYAGFRSRKSANPNAPLGELITERQTVASGEGSTLPEYDASGRAVELKTGSRVGKFGCLLLVALFWNGIVSVFVHHVVEGFQKDRPEWFLVVFLIPFVLVGLGLFGAVVHAFLGIFNPQPRLRINAAAIPLGGVLRLEWRISGNVRRIGDLRMHLRGREQATYSRGTNTHTDKHDFAELDIVRIVDPRNMASGRAEIKIPGDVMHSVDRNANKIIWTIVVSGDIKNWPDIADEFPFVVLPADTPS